MRKLFILLLSVVIILCSCQSNEPQSPSFTHLTEQEKTDLENSLSVLYRDSFQTEYVTVMYSALSPHEMEEQKIRGEITITMTLEDGQSYEEACIVGENCSKIFDSFLRDYDNGNFKIEFYINGQYRYESGITYKIN